MGWGWWGVVSCFNAQTTSSLHPFCVTSRITMAMWMHRGLIEGKWSGLGQGWGWLCGMLLSSWRAGEPFSREGAGEASENCLQGHVSPHSNSACLALTLYGRQALVALTKFITHQGKRQSLLSNIRKLFFFSIFFICPHLLLY